ncbi:hypothetical protein SNE40_017264 [Patella caerulea]|uniref:L-dopachrome isomerase n=1 Tax=Patella caerulea TaxID=87958 RepID=A0AAN8JDG8_PATCE
MPYVTVTTNASASLITETFAATLGKTVGDFLDRPEQYVTVRMVPDQLMFTGGKPIPFVHVAIESLSALNPDKNAEITPVVTKIIEENLKIPAERILFKFVLLNPTDVGINGKTFPPGFGQ